LLILLPTNLGAKNGDVNGDDKGQPKSVLAELEKLLVHAEVPVSRKFLSIRVSTFA
jgi:hypothetical protein